VLDLLAYQSLLLILHTAILFDLYIIFFRYDLTVSKCILTAIELAILAILHIFIFLLLASITALIACFAFLCFYCVVLQACVSAHCGGTYYIVFIDSLGSIYIVCLLRLTTSGRSAHGPLLCKCRVKVSINT
jgi:hypothetical protein